MRARKRPLQKDNGAEGCEKILEIARRMSKHVKKEEYIDQKRQEKRYS